MKILLIRPNSSIEAAPPPLGLLYLASFLRSRSSAYEVAVLDARQMDLGGQEITRRISAFGPDLVGITALHADSCGLHDVARIAKDCSERITVVAGGPYPSGDYQRVLQDRNVDYCVVGEGERSFLELLEAIRNKQVLTIKGVAWRDRGSIAYLGAQAPIEDLDDIPLPAWDAIDLDAYFYGAKRAVENPVQLHKEAVPILTSRGCPFGCIYCHDIFGKRFRGRSARNIFSEIQLLVRTYGVREIEIIDDTFNFDRKRLLEFCELMIGSGSSMPICFSNGIRADLVDDELLEKLKAAGVYRINYGIETASPRMQGLIGKRLNLEYAAQMIEETVRQGMLCGAFFMLGFPGETEEEVLSTIDFAVRSPLHTAVFSIVTPFPGSRLHHCAESAEDGVSFSTVGKISRNMSAMTDARLAQLRVQAYRRFYFSPRRWWALFRGVVNKRALLRNGIEVVRVSFLRKELYG